MALTILQRGGVVEAHGDYQDRCGISPVITYTCGEAEYGS